MTRTHHLRLTGVLAWVFIGGACAVEVPPCSLLSPEFRGTSRRAPIILNEDGNAPKVVLFADAYDLSSGSDGLVVGSAESPYASAQIRSDLGKFYYPRFPSTNGEMFGLVVAYDATADGSYIWSIDTQNFATSVIPYTAGVVESVQIVDLESDGVPELVVAVCSEAEIPGGASTISLELYRRMSGPEWSLVDWSIEQAEWIAQLEQALTPGMPGCGLGTLFAWSPPDPALGGGSWLCAGSGGGVAVACYLKDGGCEDDDDDDAYVPAKMACLGFSSTGAVLDSVSAEFPTAFEDSSVGNVTGLTYGFTFVRDGEGALGLATLSVMFALGGSPVADNPMLRIWRLEPGSGAYTVAEARIQYGSLDVVQPSGCGLGVGSLVVRRERLLTCPEYGSSGLDLFSWDEGGLTELGTLSGVDSAFVGLGDLDGDGDCDAVSSAREVEVASKAGSWPIKAYRNDGSNNFTPW